MQLGTQLESKLSCYTFLMRKPIALALQKVLDEISVLATELIDVMVSTENLVLEILQYQD
jgi:hypothetical protein